MIETAEENFIASENGMTLKFIREFEDREPAVPDSDDFFGVIADKEANFYRPIDIVNLGLENIYHEKLLAGETIEGDIYFQLPRDLVAKEGSLILYCSCGSDTAPLFIPSRQ